MTEELTGIQKYYTRTLQNEHGNTYYIEPREDCPLNVLNDKSQFVILTFDRDDGYIVIDNKRYYLNKFNSMRATDKVNRRVVLVDLKELKKSKSYDYENKFKRHYTSCFKDFDELEKLAKNQWLTNGAPYFKQVAKYNDETKQCTYYYEPSCDPRVAIA